MRRALPALLAALVLLAPASALAATPRTSLNDVEDEVMCVVCGVPLNIADSPQADRERALIRRLVARGDTKAQVKRALVGQYGPDVLATPGDSGFAVTNWLVPLLVVLGLLATLAVLVPRWRRRAARPAGAAAAGSNPALDAEDERRLNEDLARYR